MIYQIATIFSSKLNAVATSLRPTIGHANLDLLRIKNWLVANKLSLNVAKTERTCIGSVDQIILEK